MSPDIATNRITFVIITATHMFRQLVQLRPDDAERCVGSGGSSGDGSRHPRRISWQRSITLSRRLSCHIETSRLFPQLRVYVDDL